MDLSQAVYREGKVEGVHSVGEKWDAGGRCGVDIGGWHLLFAGDRGSAWELHDRADVVGVGGVVHAGGRRGRGLLRVARASRSLTLRRAYGNILEPIRASLRRSRGNGGVV